MLNIKNVNTSGPPTRCARQGQRNSGRSPPRPAIRKIIIQSTLRSMLFMYFILLKTDVLYSMFERFVAQAQALSNP